MKIIQKILFIVVGLFVGNAEGRPWNNNTREHLFGHVDQGNQAHVTIEDEGFRWRNSFNFTINGQAILPQNWWFSPISDIANGNFVKKNVKRYYNGGALDSNFIHSHLAKIADKIKQINNCASATTAAITIVVENTPNNYSAFSKVVVDNNKIPYVATTNGNAQNNVLNYINHDSNAISRNISGVINCNIPNGRYRCTEGRLLSMLIAGNSAVFKQTIRDLLLKAQIQTPTVDYHSIKLIVLHIGTTMDPCAICTRCLVGVSKCINENIDNFLRSTVQGAPAGNMQNAKFFIEVSSNGHYNDGGNQNDSFMHYACGNCSHTECAGHDGGEAIPINISLNFPSVGELAIPYGILSNWVLSRTFPPYVVFGRVNNATYSITQPPAYNQSDGACDNRGANVHLRHACISNLPLVQ